MLLARPGQQELARLRIAIETQRLVLFQNAMHRVAHAVFVVARLGLDGERDRGLRQFHWRIDDVEALVGQRVAGQRVLQFGDRADIAGVQFRYRLQGLPVRTAERCARRSVELRASVLQVGIVLDDAGDDLEISDAAGERIGRSLEDIGRSHAGIHDLLRGFSRR